MTKLDIRQFMCLQDSFGVLVHDAATGATAAIDAQEEGPILSALDETGWRLTDILVTHHHLDHVQAIPALKSRFGARVVGPRAEASAIPGLDLAVGQGDLVDVGGMAFEVIETPGHTRGHIAYYSAAAKLVFVGDTLFSLGCGRLFEGTPEQMWASLQKLRALPPETQVYCGHEYTLSNARFAVTVDPNNQALAERAREVERLRAAGQPTLPTTIGRERETNPFLRADDPDVRRAIGMAGAAPEAVFAELRARKNRA